MTELLHRAFLLASTRPEEEQNAIALVLLDGLEEGLVPEPFDGGVVEEGFPGRAGASPRRSPAGN